MVLFDLNSNGSHGRSDELARFSRALSVFPFTSFAINSKQTEGTTEQPVTNRFHVGARRAQRKSTAAALLGTQPYPPPQKKAALITQA